MSLGNGRKDPLAPTLAEATRLSNEGSLDLAIELLRSRATAEPEHRDRLEEAVARLEARRGIGEA